ncbi:MAG: hypothetical protein JSR96_15510 [Proteobacteria bacterium]|nr:hypothetical protein [Pseudomonadota bacterium]
MDDLDGARRMGREGQTAMGLSVQEQGAYDQGRRERQRAMEGWSQPAGGGGGGGGALAMLFIIAPALAAPGMLVLATWAYFSETQHWDWPVLTAICIVEVIAMIWLTVKFYAVTPAVVTSVITSLYLGISYGACTLLFAGWGVSTSAFVGVGAGALGYLAGLRAQNTWMSGRAITTAVAISGGLALITFAFALSQAAGLPAWLALALRWSGVGLLAGAALHMIFMSKWTVIGAFALGALLLWQMPEFVGELTLIALGLGPGAGL